MPLVEFFGDTPRVRVLEAILELAPFGAFTMKDVAHQAGLYPPSTYRTIRRLAQEGFLERSESVRPERFCVPAGTPRIQLLGLIEAAVGLFTGRAQYRTPEEILPAFRRATENILRASPTHAPRRMAVVGGKPLTSSKSRPSVRSARAPARKRN